MFYKTKATKKILSLTKRIRAVQGGTAASKTISILLYLIALAQHDKEPTLTSVVSESIPHLRRGAMRDFENILRTQGYWRESSWNATNLVYTFETGSKIEFFGADMPEKLRGARRHRLFINECNNVPLMAFNELEVRTQDLIFLDWNPTNEFWFYDEVKENRKEDLDYITLTYQDNEALPESVVKAIESRKGNKNWWLVYGMGQLGEAEGRIFTGWQFIDEIPHEARLERRGLDFGYSNDPTAIVDIYYYNGGYIFDEQLYQPLMSNRQIADVIENLRESKTLIKADSAEPKSIDELKSFGINIMPAEKGQGSVNQGIQHVQDQQISVTKRSTNLIKEYRNYMWETDKDGRILNVPEDQFNHCMDAIRYGMEKLRQHKDRAKYTYVGGDPVTRFGRKRVKIKPRGEI